MDEFDFIAGKLFTEALPKEKQYLLKHLRLDVQREFMRYFIFFGTTAHFVNRTGVYCSPHWQRKLKKKILKLEALHEQAKREMNLELLTALETGKKIPAVPPVYKLHDSRRPTGK